MEETMEEGTSKIIILTGPESTGKSQLTSQLSEVYKGKAIKEYAREYISRINRAYIYDDLVAIAFEQKKQFSEVASSPIAFFDTYLIITKVWFKWVFGKYPLWLDIEIHKTRHCLYLLCKPDTPWEKDVLRENGGENRIKLYNLYKNELDYFNLSYFELGGVNSERLKNAQKIVKKYIDNK